MSYRVIIFMFFVSILFTYFSLYICNYINNNDEQNINCSSSIKIFLSISNSILVTIILIKYSLSIYSMLYVMTWLMLFITAYIDYSTKYIYEITSRPLLFISSILFITNLLIGVTTITDIIWLIISVLIVILFGKLRYIGKGDIDIFLAVMMILNDYKVALILLIFSLGISGLASIFLIITKKVGLEYRKPLCPSIAVATYLILILL
jgi:leader peptidase (prepilin peptidase) / N-methyltransferase